MERELDDRYGPPPDEVEESAVVLGVEDLGGVFGCGEYSAQECGCAV